MDEASVRAQLQQIRIALDANEKEHAILFNLMQGYEALLRLHSGAPIQSVTVEAASPATGPKAAALATNVVKGTISFRGAILEVIREARGAPLHSKEIFQRALAKGVITKAKNPAGVTDLTAHSLSAGGAPIERTGPRTWRWIGSTQFELPGVDASRREETALGGNP